MRHPHKRKRQPGRRTLKSLRRRLRQWHAFYKNPWFISWDRNKLRKISEYGVEYFRHTRPA